MTSSMSTKHSTAELTERCINKTMNEYFSKTILPTPAINWKTIWPEIVSNDDPIDIGPRFRLINTRSATLSHLWPEGDFANRLKDIGLQPNIVRIFRWAPNRSFSWHIDGTTKPRFCALNWILDGFGKIQWDRKFKWDESAGTNVTFKNKIGNDNDPFEIDSEGHSCLVNTLIPHRVVNFNNVHRVSISVLVNENLSYTEVYNRLASVELIQSVKQDTFF